MRCDWRALICLFLGIAIFAILVSPLVPSPPTTLRARYVAVAAMMIFSLAALSLTQVAFALQRRAAAIYTHAGRSIFDLTTARLC